MTQPPDESPTQRQPASPTWVGSAKVPPGGSRRRRNWEDTLDVPAEQPQPETREMPRTRELPAVPEAPPPPRREKREKPPKIQYVPVVPPGYGPLPPGYRPGPFPPPQYRRRRRKWPWVFLVLLVLCAGCCGGSYAWARPWWVQYPASVNTDAGVTGLTKLNDTATTKTAEQLQTALTSDHLDEAGFTAAYQDPADGRAKIVVFGATRFITDPARDLDASLRKLGAKIPISNVREVDPGVFGGEKRCAASRFDGRSATVCGWADHGVIAIAVFVGKSTDAASDAMQNIRAAIVNRD
ncbi:hypothetical protein Dvina_47720 [Dactylosporangium vinaceum]|uniref:Uncharacterized protein n=1 Tax=Dactylosporangium vinaceum TaxID=53362 RepID=A0ABV5M5M9_9ACTN|nr:hypothetical protein [Dactylosporangium vinaceum]UAB95616.1 hypothetical protein Dvina_47720 [Dactylosporangium vinaceum]